MPPSKRKARRKPHDVLDSSELDLPDSSPTRPSAKKRKVNTTRSALRRQSATPDPDHDRDQSIDHDPADEAEGVSQTDLIDSVVSYLQVSKDPIVVSVEHSNDKEQNNSPQKVSAYAKIAGRDWTYFVREQSVNFGRPPDDRPTVNGASSPIADLKDVFPVHIDLGPSKIVSRHHASIYYDADFPEDEGGWHVRVNGRNGVRVNNVLIKKGLRRQIKSGDILEIAGTQMMFVTPGDKVQIDQYFIDRAKALAAGDDLPLAPPHAHPEPARFDPAPYAVPPGFPSLAPAPPNLKREATPPNQVDGGKTQRGVFDSKMPMSPMYGRGMMMESTQEIDYSRDSAKDLKPPFSYATMIAQAIFSSDEEKLTLSNIYSFIADKYAFYRHSNSGWQNSIRHNLSLNKAFQKVPRRTDEPGKGMKWQIAPEFRQEYWKKQARRGGGGSAPSSPASSKDVNPNFRGPNGQNLGYDTSMVSSFSAKDSQGRALPPTPKVNLQFPPLYPPGSSAPTLAPPFQQHQEAITPQRRRTDTLSTLPDTEIDDSPLPHRHGGPTPRMGNGLPAYTLPSSVPPTHHSPTNPTLSSSYLDTPFRFSQHSIITPAPLRQNPRLAPPSTLVAPSKFMPESSPAGPGLFWKGLMGVTPGHQVPDISPVKDEDPRSNGIDRHVMSSSPPPMDAGLASPSKPARGSQAPTASSSSVKKEGTPSFNHMENGSATDENGRFNRSIGDHAGKASPFSLAPGRASTSGSFNNATQSQGNNSNPDPRGGGGGADDDDDDDGADGFDLAKGFAPIASQSFHSNRSSSIGVARAGS